MVRHGEHGQLFNEVCARRVTRISDVEKAFAAARTSLRGGKRR